MTTVKCIVIHVHTVFIYIYVSKNKHRYICIKYITKLLQLVLLPCYKMMKSGTFSKRLGAATKGFESCEFWFQVAYFKYSFVFSGIVSIMEENNH